MGQVFHKDGSRHEIRGNCACYCPNEDSLCRLRNDFGFAALKFIPHPIQQIRHKILFLPSIRKKKTKIFGIGGRDFEIKKILNENDRIPGNVLTEMDGRFALVNGLARLGIEKI